MRLTIHNLITRPLHGILVLALTYGVVLSHPAYALKSDPRQPINVESTEQSADLQTNKIVFFGAVIATQGSMKVKADKIEVLRNSDGSLKSIIAYGSPTTFEQKQDNGQYLRSRSSTLSYNPKNATIVLQGRVTLWQGDSKMSGERIEYNINSQKMRANNNNQGGRVSSTIVPSSMK